MAGRKKIEINITRVCTPEESKEVIKAIAKNEIEKYLHKEGVVATNLDEVLDKYINPLPENFGKSSI